MITSTCVSLPCLAYPISDWFSHSFPAKSCLAFCLLFPCSWFWSLPVLGFSYLPVSLCPVICLDCLLCVNDLLNVYCITSLDYPLYNKLHLDPQPSCLGAINCNILTPRSSPPRSSIRELRCPLRWLTLIIFQVTGWRTEERGIKKASIWVLRST